MKRILVSLMAGLLLAGCGAEPVYETLGDVWAQTEPAAMPGRMELPLPEGARMEVMEGDGSSFYQVGQWDLWTKVMTGGDVRRTLQTLSGLDGRELTVLSRESEEWVCHESTWTAVGENGERVVRAGILDDGSYHYCICLSAPVEEGTAAGDAFALMLRSASITNTAP